MEFEVLNSRIELEIYEEKNNSNSFQIAYF
jgi:hypothetical protein